MQNTRDVPDYHTEKGGGEGEYKTEIAIVGSQQALCINIYSEASNKKQQACRQEPPPLLQARTEVHAGSMSLLTTNCIKAWNSASTSDGSLPLTLDLPLALSFKHPQLFLALSHAPLVCAL